LTLAAKTLSTSKPTLPQTRESPTTDSQTDTHFIKTVGAEREREREWKWREETRDGVTYVGREREMSNRGEGNTEKEIEREGECVLAKAREEGRKIASGCISLYERVREMRVGALQCVYKREREREGGHSGQFFVIWRNNARI